MTCWGSRMYVTSDNHTTMGQFLQAWNYFLTVCGLNCVEIIRNNNQILRFEVSRWKFLIPLTILSLIFVLIYKLIYDNSLTEIDEGETMVSGYLNISGNVVAAVTIICATISSKAYASVKIRFTHFDDMVTINYKTITKSIIKYATFLFSIYLFSFVTDFLVYKIDNSPSAGLKIISAYVFQFYNLISILHFSVCLFWLRKSFTIINLDLETNGRLVGSLSKKEDVHNFFKQNVVNPAFSFQYIKLREISSREMGSSIVERLKFLRSLYHAAFELTQDVNQVFATRNLISVGYNFLVGTIFMYFGISELVRRSTASSDASTLQLLVHFKWSFISFLSIYGLIWPCTSTCNEVKKTAIIIEGLLTKTMNEELQGELQSTAFQFVHEQVSFSPHGFFTLNNNLLLSITGAVVSYLVVLIQFRVTMA